MRPGANASSSPTFPKSSLRVSSSSTSRRPVNIAAPPGTEERGRWASFVPPPCGTPDFPLASLRSLCYFRVMDSASPASSTPSVDFFVSYTGRDKAWAEWIAWQLEHAGFRVLI